MNKFDKALEAEIQRLPKTREPERDLWRGIELSLHSQVSGKADENGLNNEPSGQDKRGTIARLSTKPWLAMAASAMLVSVIWFFSPAFTTDETSGEQPKLAGYALVDALSEQQDDQMTSLLASYDSAPELSENWQAQLKELDDAAGVIKAALKDDPNNRALLKMLKHVYQQQITLIERVHAPKWQQI
ncbi:conserved hypothetical protein [Alteromonas sp. 38]|uniref:hypothetical protein n=1 Tax=unclassified Alteromonas TaxID=2614992 RepID=UPI0012EF5D0A|nr:MULTISPECIES: hypothetical protein [unclassified Alteromonas]CAD5249170.1 conserved hypothetical protein [Alteromonas sp. 154]VXC47012.1 conserved hypothetical protein [Alteromonas sp. 38]